ncbi:MAG TPA: hypothetical protein VMZ06_15830 [Candidatus Bathyarchaeia archaeon]|nr:hypothetical protein [Candidatus Bathyarchaeia archaeon]
MLIVSYPLAAKSGEKGGRCTYFNSAGVGSSPLALEISAASPFFWDVVGGKKMGWFFVDRFGMVFGSRLVFGKMF